MTQNPADQGYLAAQNPDTAPEVLQALAGRRPDLWEEILKNPNTYPGLAEWIRGRQAAGEPAPRGLAALAAEAEKREWGWGFFFGI